MSTFVAASQTDWPVPLNPVQLQGNIVLLEPLVAEHEQELIQVSQDLQIWRYLTSFGGSPDAMRIYLEDALRDYAKGSALPFVIRNASNQCALGMTRLKNLSRTHRNARVGSWLIPSAWGTGANMEAKLLLLEYAFEILNCIRVEFHTDSRNVRSRVALTKMGALEEGTLRACFITRDGSHRDSIVFSILDTEWVSVKERLRMRLQAQLLPKETSHT